jgi:bacillithiol biosynthesis cysteine-adding enzyme BshC
MSELEVQTEELGGSPLAQAAIAGRAADTWYEPRPAGPTGWTRRVAAVRGAVPAGDALRALAPAIAAGGAAADRLGRVQREGGVLVTTGQQPGLFGGPIYTWSKALSALALADELERVTGVPTAPLFWAATDDADFAEASWTVVSLPGGAGRLATQPVRPVGPPMSAMPLGDVGPMLDELVRAAGPAVDRVPLDAVRQAYAAGATVGDAYVALLRRLLEPLGIAVLDASHSAVVAASRPLLRRALERCTETASALRAREAEIAAAGFAAQVGEVAGLSLVFERDASSKTRIPVARAVDLANDDGPTLSPNVLLRPVVECTILPTVAYVAGPGEIAYFAQVSAVADSLGARRPLAVPRWSCTIIEPHIRRLLSHLGLAPLELADPHAAETRLARASLPAPALAALSALRQSLNAGVAQARGALAAADGAAPPAVLDGLASAIEKRIARFERRLVAGVKRREHELMTQVATARGALYPLGKRQERALNLLPIMARHGALVFERMLDRAREHARELAGGDARVDSVSSARTFPSDRDLNALDARAR